MAKMKMKLYPRAPRRKQNHFHFTEGGSGIQGTYLKRDMERFAVNILKALKSKKLK
jgi:hypothetical protein